MSSPKITLYTAPTPNGIKISMALEELGIPYEEKRLAFGKNEQKEPWFLKINPNGRIPAITDHNSPVTGGEFHVFESGSILQYLVDQYDKDHKLSYKHGTKEYYEMLQWVFFQNAGVGPMQGQANHFVKFAPERIEYGMKRYTDETKRLYSVLDTRLASQPSGWLVGDHISIADITTFGWVYASKLLEGKVDLAEFPKLKEWKERIEAREATKKGNIMNQN
ncbi:glutathione S-transferase [Atractiella rhizophila]|nr:glutathione S-transferase [Atractiella rhizophila]